MINNLIDTSKKWERYSGQELSAIATNHLFRIKISDSLKYITDFTSVLSKEEIERSSRFIKQEDKDNYRVRRYALRIILGQFLGLPPADILYHKTGNKKPAVNHLQFNTSHTKDYAVIAISQEPIGADIEYLNRDFDYSDLLPTCFNAEESQFITHTADMQQNFYILWTRKEALIKASAEGLVENPAEITSLDQVAEREGNKYQVTSFSSDDLLLSIAFAPSLKKLKLWEYSPSSCFL